MLNKTTKYYSYKNEHLEKCSFFIMHIAKTAYKTEITGKIYKNNKIAQTFFQNVFFLARIY